MWALFKWVFYTVLAIAGVYLALGIGAILAVVGAALGTICIGGFTLLAIVLMVQEFFEGKKNPPS